MHLPIYSNSRKLEDSPEFPIGDDVMRKVTLCFSSFFLSLSICAFAGSLKMPIRIPAETMPEQQAVIREGIVFHDQGDKRICYGLRINPKTRQESGIWIYAALARTGARREAGFADPGPVSGTSRHTRRNVRAKAIICAPK